MKELWLKYHKSFLLVFGYIVVASVVYGVWFHALFKLWYVDFLVILFIVIVGVICGYFYIRSIDAANKENNMSMTFEKFLK